jgi:hypothetical protein
MSNLDRPTNDSVPTVLNDVWYVLQVKVQVQAFCSSIAFFCPLDAAAAERNSKRLVCT